MIIFPNSKINIGLNITSKRPDNYHNIETVFFPIDLHDALEILDSAKFEFVNKGLSIDCDNNDNLCVKAYNVLKAHYSIPPVKIVLYKKIPFGTGLGAGSSNAAFTLKLLNEKYHLNINNDELSLLASEIGADCAFFIRNMPAFAQQKGDLLTPINLSLKEYYIMICFSDISVSTKKAYENCKPSKPEKSLKELVQLPLTEWKDFIVNDFENTVFNDYPKLKHIKEDLYEKGAVFGQMTGSGSAVYGIFESNPENINIESSAKSLIVKSAY